MHHLIGTKVFDYHHENHVLAYEAAGYVILWDLEANKKVMVHPHEFNISTLLFFGTNQEYLLSIDNGLPPTIFISLWQSFTPLHHKRLPENIKSQSAKNYFCSYSYSNNMIIIVGNYQGQYTFSIWNFEDGKLDILHDNNEETLTNCLGVHIFEKTSSLSFALVEKRCIKYWKLDGKKLLLANRIHVKEDIINAHLNPVKNFLFFLNEQGRLYIINKEGQYVSSLVHPELRFSALSLYEDYLFLGTTEGQIEIYQQGSLQYLKSMKNLKESILSSRNILPTNQSSQKQESAELHKSPKSNQKEEISKSSDCIQKIIVASLTSQPYDTLPINFSLIIGNHDLVIVNYQDDNLFCYNYMNDKVDFAVVGHCKKIQSIKWSPGDKKIFVSCCNNGTVRIWNFIGDRWKPSEIEIPIEKSQAHPIWGLADSFYSQKQKHLSLRDYKKHKYKVTAMDVDWQSEKIYVADNLGNLLVFNLKTGSLKQSVPISGFKISSIAVSLHYLAIAQSSGHTSIFEKSSNFEVFLKLEEAHVESNIKTKFYKGVHLIEPDTVHPTKKEMESPKKYPKVGEKQLKSPILKPLENAQTILSDEKDSSKTKVITINNVNTLRMHEIQKNKDALSSVPLVNYYLEGRVMDVQVHPSNDYIVVLADDGFVSLFKLSDGELRGRIEVKPFSTKLALDPAGLYLLVASPCLLNQNANNGQTDGVYKKTPDRGSQFITGGNKTKDGAGDESFKHIDARFNPEQSRISVYEIGTGEFTGEIDKVSAATALSFSFDGSFLAVGSEKGQINVLGIDPNLRENIFEVLDGMQKSPNFWNNYPLRIEQQPKEKNLHNYEGPKESKYSIQPNDFVQTGQPIPQQQHDFASYGKHPNMSANLLEPKASTQTAKNYQQQKFSLSRTQQLQKLQPSAFTYISPPLHDQKNQREVFQHLNSRIAPQQPVDQALLKTPNNKMGSVSYVSNEPKNLAGFSPFNGNVKNVGINNSASINLNKQSLNIPLIATQSHIDRAKKTAKKIREINFAHVESIESQNSKFPQTTPSKQKIYSGVSPASREIETELDPVFAQRSTHPFHTDYQRDINPDPSDIDIDASANKVKADPENIDDNIIEAQNRRQQQHYHEPQRQYESDYHMDYALRSSDKQVQRSTDKQVQRSTKPKFPSRPQIKEETKNYTDLNDESPSNVFNQINEFERRFQSQGGN